MHVDIVIRRVDMIKRDKGLTLKYSLGIQALVRMRRAPNIIMEVITGPTRDSLMKL